MSQLVLRELFYETTKLAMIPLGGQPAAKGSSLVRKHLVDDPAAVFTQDFPILTTAMPIDRLNRRIAFGVLVLLIVTAAIVAPFANISLARVDAFIPVLQTVMCVVDLITATILFGQYSMGPRYALLAIASGYVFSGLFALLQTFAFPGAYSATGLIGDGVNSAAWLFVLWHSSFDVAVIAYTVLKDRDEAGRPSNRANGVVIGTTIAVVGGITFALTWIVTGGAKHLPTLYTGLTRQTAFANELDIFLWSFGATALLLLFFRRSTILDLWLIVILLAWWPNFILPVFVTIVRFTLGWYVARVFALFASSTLLIVLLAESMTLYVRLANNIRLLRRERADRLTGLDAATAAMAHEIRQPLGAIMNYSATAAILLGRAPPNLTEAVECLVSIDEAAGMAESRIASIRKLFGTTAHQRTAVQLSDVAKQTLALLEHDMRTNRIEVSTEYQDNIPSVKADGAQLLEVVFNIVRNAIEAMTTSNNERRLRLLTGLNGSTVSLYIQDSGPGIAAENRAHIFDAFFTTKRTGMGLGLSICRAIIKAHRGELRLAKTDARGTSFEIALPIDSADDNDRGPL
jgi:signal transduction histidine kinase